MQSLFPSWSGPMLRAAGIYNILWGAWVVLFPLSFFQWTDLPLPAYPMIWQSVGMIVGVYGLGYFIASYNPVRHWPIILVGFLGKIFGPIGAIYYGVLGTFPWVFGLNNITNDLIWIVPFGIVLFKVWKIEMNTFSGEKSVSQEEAVQNMKLSAGSTVFEASFRQEVMLLFVRHMGCTFCREALADLKEKLPVLQQKNILPVVVHMSSEPTAAQYFSQNGLSAIEAISDPNCVFYEAFSLKRGSFQQLFGWREWIRGFEAGLIRRHGIGLPEGDGFRMPGAFIIRNGEVVQSWRSNRASEKVPFQQLEQACELAQ